MKPAKFKYEKPETVDALIAALATHGEKAKILAGGQSLVPMMNFRAVAPEILLDINGLNDLDYVRVVDGCVAIGALTRHAAISGSATVKDNCPLVSDAYAYVANKTIRNRGTIGGNLAHNDPASEMPAVMVCLGAEFVFRGPEGSRTVAAADFFIGPLETALEPTEFLTEIQIPVADKREGWSFQEFSPRKGDFAVAAVAATIRCEKGVCGSARIAYAGVADMAARAPDPESVLIGKSIDDDLIARAADVASSSVEPTILNYHGDAHYKRDLVRSLTVRALSVANSRRSRPKLGA